jgi:heat shock protein HtpX
MKRIGLFLLTNLAILIVLSITLRVLGIDRVLDERGGLDFNALLGFAAVIGFGGAFLSLAMSKWLAKRATGARVIAMPANGTERWLTDTVRRQADAVGIGMPEVAIYDSPAPNAFATGMRRDHALVAVSTGLLERMDQGEVEAVLAHEVSHVANGDMVTLALIQGVLNTFVIFLARVVGFVVDRVVFRTEDGHGPGYFIVSLVAEILLGVLAMMIVMAVSRRREFRADAGAARLVGAQRMIAALRRLQQAQPEPLPAQIAAFGIFGGTAGGLKALFMSHPPLQARIDALHGATQAWPVGSVSP